VLGACFKPLEAPEDLGLGAILTFGRIDESVALLTLRFDGALDPVLFSSPEGGMAGGSESPSPAGFLLRDLEVLMPDVSVMGFDVVTNRSIAPRVMPGFLVPALLAAAFAFKNFLGSLRDSS